MAFPKHTKPIYIPHGGPDKVGAWVMIFLMHDDGKKYYQKVWAESESSFPWLLKEMKNVHCK